MSIQSRRSSSSARARWSPALRSGASPGARAIVGVIAAAVLTGPFVGTIPAVAGEVPHCSQPGQITPHPDHWYSIKAPRFSAGPQLITDYGVDPLVPERLFVTNGTEVMRSTDSGCIWSLSYSVPTGSLAGGTGGRILEIEISAPGTAYLPIQMPGPAPRPLVVVTRDAGATWSDASGPVLGSITGTIRDLDVSMGNPSAGALLIDLEVNEPGVVSYEGDQMVLTTSTAGETWEPLHVTGDGHSVTVGGATTDVGGINPIGDLRAITMNPTVPSDLWVYGDGGTFHSDGTNLNRVDLGVVKTIDIALDGSSVVAIQDATRMGQVSVDGGGSFESFPTYVPVDSVDVVSGGVMFLSGSGIVFQQTSIPGLGPVLRDISPDDRRAIADVTFALSGSIYEDPMVFGSTGQTIEVAFQPEGREVDPTTVAAVIPPELDIPTNYLEPASRRIVMRPGQTRTIDYSLGLPAASTPLDVYFMIDISGSMGGAINGVRSGMRAIIENLQGDKVDVNFGVGVFRSYEDPPAYERVRDIAPPTPDLADALNSLNARGGGQESQMGALLQSATGDGDDVIPPNLNMNFRPGSLRVAIEVTDEPISRGGRHPAWTTVAEALNDHDVMMVGIALMEPPLLGEPDYSNPGDPAEVLQEIATATGAVALEDGVDCDNDGDVEIEMGNPLVCILAPARADEADTMAGVIVGFLNAIQDIQDLGVQIGPSADASADSPVVESVEPSVLPGVDLKRASAHEFSVTVRCPHVSTKTTYPLTVGVTRTGGFLEQAMLTVVCDPPPGRKEFTTLFPAIVPVAAVPPPPPRPPDPIPEPNPNPNPQQNPQTQAGFAAQEQQQPQVAVAHQQAPGLDVAEQGATDEYLMTSREESRVPPVGFVFAAGAITSLYAFAAVSRGRVRTAHVRDKRRQ